MVQPAAVASSLPGLLDAALAVLLDQLREPGAGQRGLAAARLCTAAEEPGLTGR